MPFQLYLRDLPHRSLEIRATHHRIHDKSLSSRSNGTGSPQPRVGYWMRPYARRRLRVLNYHVPPTICPLLFNWETAPPPAERAQQDDVRVGALSSRRAPQRRILSYWCLSVFVLTCTLDQEADCIPLCLFGSVSCLPPNERASFTRHFLSSFTLSLIYLSIATTYSKQTSTTKTNR